MFQLSVNKYRWRISKDGQTVLSGIGTAEQALALAKTYGIYLSKINDLNHLKRVA